MDGKTFLQFLESRIKESETILAHFAGRLKNDPVAALQPIGNLSVLIKHTAQLEIFRGELSAINGLSAFALTQDETVKRYKTIRLPYMRSMASESVSMELSMFEMAKEMSRRSAFQLLVALMEMES